jgi:hypothetical protein
MLKVGFVEVLQVGNGWFHELVKRDLISTGLYRDARLRFARSPYVNAPGCDTYDADIPLFQYAHGKMGKAHAEAIRIAARSHRHTSTAKDHSPEFVRFLSQLLVRPLPQPTYAMNEAEKAYPEGAAIQMLITKYEHDPAARRRCIEHYGTDCFVCGLRMSDRYGHDVAGLIHVHHLQPIAALGEVSALILFAICARSAQTAMPLSTRKLLLERSKTSSPRCGDWGACADQVSAQFPEGGRFGRGSKMIPTRLAALADLPFSRGGKHRARRNRGCATCSPAASSPASHGCPCCR